MATPHKHPPINLQEVLNAFDHTLQTSEKLGWKHLKHDLLRIHRAHEHILEIFDDKKLDANTKFNKVAELILLYYQEELTLAKATDSADFVKKINQRNDHLHYARVLGLILRDLSPKVTDEELIKLLRSRKLNSIKEIPHDRFYDTTPLKGKK